ERRRAPVARGWRALVPVGAGAAQGLQDLADGGLGRAAAVRVLDPKHEDALMAPGEGPVEEGRAGAPHVKGARRTRREANPDRLRHARSSYRVRSGLGASPRAEGGG